MPPLTTGHCLSVRSYSTGQASHSHPHHQIILSLRGALDLETEVSRDLVDDRKFAVVATGREHAYCGLGDNRFLILDVDDRTAPLRAAAGRPFFAVSDPLDRLLEFARHSGDDAFGEAGFRTCLSGLILHEVAAQSGGTRVDPPDALLTARAYARARYADPISVQDMAEAANVSVATLHRLFRRWQGQTPAKYLSGVRLAKAKALLVHGRAPIAQIAIACGYSEQSALTRALRREHGLTPADFRKRVRQSA